jgi:hypothetical protein
MGKRLRAGALGVMLALATTAWATEKKDVLGTWGLDAATSGAAADGNTAGVMNSVEFKADGTFAAQYGIGGTWAIKGGKLLVTYQNSFRHDEEAKRDGKFLKMPAPAMSGKFCYLVKK